MMQAMIKRQFASQTIITIITVYIAVYEFDRIALMK